MHVRNYAPLAQLTTPHPYAVALDGSAARFASAYAPFAQHYPGFMYLTGYDAQLAIACPPEGYAGPIFPCAMPMAMQMPDAALMPPPALPMFPVLSQSAPLSDAAALGAASFPAPRPLSLPNLNRNPPTNSNALLPVHAPQSPPSSFSPPQLPSSSPSLYLSSGPALSHSNSKLSQSNPNLLHSNPNLSLSNSSHSPSPSVPSLPYFVPSSANPSPAFPHYPANPSQVSVPFPSAAKLASSPNPNPNPNSSQTFLSSSPVPFSPSPPSSPLFSITLVREPDRTRFGRRWRDKLCTTSTFSLSFASPPSKFSSSKREHSESIASFAFSFEISPEVPRAEVELCAYFLVLPGGGEMFPQQLHARFTPRVGGECVILVFVDLPKSEKIPKRCPEISGKIVFEMVRMGVVVARCVTEREYVLHNRKEERPGKRRKVEDDRAAEKQHA